MTGENKIEFEKGNRVKSKFFGSREVRQILKSDLTGDIIYYLVKWDKTPPIQYNMGKNPCLASPEELTNN